MLPKPKELQMREPLRQPKSKITSAASRIKAINEIHRNQKHSQKRPNPQGAAFLAENVQGFKTTESNLKNKDASITACYAVMHNKFTIKRRNDLKLTDLSELLLPVSLARSLSSLPLSFFDKGTSEKKI